MTQLNQDLRCFRVRMTVLAMVAKLVRGLPGSPKLFVRPLIHVILLHCTEGSWGTVTKQCMTISGKSRPVIGQLTMTSESLCKLALVTLTKLCLHHNKKWLHLSPLFLSPPCREKVVPMKGFVESPEKVPNSAECQLFVFVFIFLRGRSRFLISEAALATLTLEAPIRTSSTSPRLSQEDTFGDKHP